MPGLKVECLFWWGIVGLGGVLCGSVGGAGDRSCVQPKHYR